MWRTGLVLFLTITIVTESSKAEVRHGDLKLIERLKRSAEECGPPYWPPPPPPPYWPHHRHHHWGPPPPPPPPPPQQIYVLESQPLQQGYSANPGPSQVPCTTCGGGSPSGAAVSNAESVSGSAIAVAVAKAQGK